MGDATDGGDDEGEGEGGGEGEAQTEDSPPADSQPESTPTEPGEPSDATPPQGGSGTIDNAITDQGNDATTEPDDTPPDETPPIPQFSTPDSMRGMGVLEPFEYAPPPPWMYSNPWSPVEPEPDTPWETIPPAPPPPTAPYYQNASSPKSNQDTYREG
jgi:hypothetical protein